MPALTSMLAVAGLVGGGITAYGQIKEGQEIKKAQEYNANVAQEEAGLVQQNQVLNEYRQRKQLRQDVGMMNAGYSKAGVSVNTGSPLDAIADGIANAELDIALGKYNADVQSNMKLDEAKQLRTYGAQADRAGWMRAGATLLTSGVDTGFKLSKEKNLFGKTKVGQ